MARARLPLIVAATLIAVLPILLVVRLAMVGHGGLLPSPEDHGILVDEAIFASATAIGEGGGLVIVMSAVIVALLAARRYRAAVWLPIVVVSASLVGRILKAIVHAPRPSLGGIDKLPISIPDYVVIALAVGVFIVAWLLGARRQGLVTALVILGVLLVELASDRVIPLRAGFDSFPSGHATGSMALAAATAVLAWPTRYRWWVLAGAVAYVLIVGVSRLYLGVHLPADVLAGWCLALAIVLLAAPLLTADDSRVADRSD